MTNSQKALEFIQDGAVVGLGSGHAAAEFIRALGRRVERGLRIAGIPTSQESANLATQLGISLTTLDAVDAQVDVTVDGADEVDRNLNLIKGLGGALVREKIVAAASRSLVILIGPDNLDQKDTGVLGTRGILPVEIVPFSLAFCQRRLAALGFPSSARRAGENLFVTDNGNFILDCAISPLADPARLEQEILSIPGIVDTGLFIGMADVVLVQDGNEVEIRRRNDS